MTMEELSNRILDEGFGLGIEHSDDSHDEKLNNDTATSLGENNTSIENDLTNSESDSLTHYGVPGMKWGVRKDRKKKDRRYEDETDQEYQNRMTRESQARSEKFQAKERASTQKRMLKSQERIKKMELKAQQKNKELDIAERKRQEKRADKAEAERKKAERRAAKEQTKSKSVNTRTLSDRELNDAIQRLRNEQTYKQLSLENKSLPKKTVIKAATVGGGILLAVGTAVAKQQLTAVGNMKAEEFLKKRGIEVPKGKEKGMSPDDFLKMFNKLKEEGKIV